MTFSARKDADIGTYELLSVEAKKAIGDGKRVVGVQALDFGQGDCNAIVIGSKEDAEPIVFCDVGGGKGPSGGGTHPWHASNDRKTTLKLDLRPTIIQSHWDGDHYSTALFIWQKAKGHQNARDVPAVERHKKIYEECAWLVRRQRNGPSSTDFVRGVQKMVCWPENLPAHSFEIGQDMFLRVERCTGDNAANTDRNLCGLAVRLISTADIPDSSVGSSTKATTIAVSSQSNSSMVRDDEVDEDEGSPSEGQLHADDGQPVDSKTPDPGDEVTDRVAKQILLPGDAPFQCLPSHKKVWHSANVTALFAYHHGSHTHLAGNVIPNAGTTVYTYGLKEGGKRCSYGHPHMDAVKAYENEHRGIKVVRLAPAGSAKDPEFEASNKKRGDCFISFESARSSPESETSKSGPKQGAEPEKGDESTGSSASKTGPITRSRRRVVIVTDEDQK